MSSPQGEPAGNHRESARSRRLTPTIEGPFLVVEYQTRKSKQKQIEDPFLVVKYQTRNIKSPQMANLTQQNVAFASALVPFRSCQTCAVVCVDGTVMQESMPQGCSF